MCGIAGYVTTKNSNSLSIGPILSKLSHRGPDDIGYYEDDQCSIGMTRLAIVDVHNGKQPAVDNTNQLAVVFNGEIYNFKELVLNFCRSFSTCTEAELIGHLYRQFGSGFVKLLRGMYAIAIWDRNSRKLLLIRDRFGEKPLFWFMKNEVFYFSSEVSALPYHSLNLSINTRSLFSLFRYGYIEPDSSIFNEIQALPPASILHYQNNSVRIERYWSANSVPKIQCTRVEAEQIIDEALEESVFLQSYSERPMGVYLSGGVDSSLIAYYLSRLHYDQIKTFSIGFQETYFDESDLAVQVSKSIGSEHHSLQLIPSQADLEECLNALDQPFADSSFFATYFLNKFAKANGIIVAFGGDGGDESSLGYDRYRALYLSTKYSSFLELISEFKILKGTASPRYRKFLDAISRSTSLDQTYQSFIEFNSRNDILKLLSPEFTNELDFSLANTFSDSSDLLTIMDEVSHFDLQTYLPGDILSKVDIASMANGIEVRSPFLDHKYFEKSVSIPTKMKINSWGTKLILKRIATQKIPQVNFYRKKMGFGIPRADWLRGPFLPYVEDVLLGRECRERGWFNADYLNQVVKEHKTGFNRDSLIWPALVIENWARNSKF